MGRSSTAAALAILSSDRESAGSEPNLGAEAPEMKSRLRLRGFEHNSPRSTRRPNYCLRLN